MANRVLIGKGSTARGSSNYGAWISRPGKDVLTCSDDELIFAILFAISFTIIIFFAYKKGTNSK